MEYIHRLIIKEGTEFYLFGSDYWADKRNFNLHHRAILESMCEKIHRRGYPLEIKDIAMKEKRTIDTVDEMRAWLKETQPSGASDYI